MKNPKLALCQMKVTDSTDKNLETAYKAIERAHESGADIVVLPEMFICPYNNESFVENKIKSDSHVVRGLSEIAKNKHIWLVSGSIPEFENGKIYNTSLIFNRDGVLAAKHRKVHLFDIDVPGKIKFAESETLTGGSDVTIFDTEFGKIGVAICFDIRFTEFFRLYAIEGADLIIVPAAFNMTTGPAHWHLTARTRALDNQLSIALCSPARDEKSTYTAYGHSLIADAWGEVTGELDEKEGILIKEVSFNKNKTVRMELPILKGRRKDVYDVVKK